MCNAFSTQSPNQFEHLLIRFKQPFHTTNLHNQPYFFLSSLKNDGDGFGI